MSRFDLSELVQQLSELLKTFANIEYIKLGYCNFGEKCFRHINVLCLFSRFEKEDVEKGAKTKKTDQLTMKIIALEEIQSTKRNCDQCNHTLESQKESLKQPSIIFQSRTIETHLYPCETCEFTSISREDMTAHAKSKESYQSMWICCYVSRKY